MTHRPFRTAANNLVTLEDEVQNYYQQVHYQEESDEEYESDEDEDPTGEQLYIQLSITILMRMKNMSMKKKMKDVMIYTIRPTQLKGPALGSLKQEISHPSYP